MCNAVRILSVFHVLFHPFHYSLSFFIHQVGHLPPPAGPAHWSTTVTVTPECRPQLRNGADQRGMNGIRAGPVTTEAELHRQRNIISQQMNNGNSLTHDVNGHGNFVHNTLN